MKKTFLLLSCFIASILLYSTETIIQGNISAFNGKTLKVSLISDYLTFTSEEVAKTLISKGKFKITLQLDDTQQVFLKIEDKQTSFFAKPGEVYNLNLSYDAQANQGRAFDKYLDLKFSYPRTDEINQLIKSFNTAYQNFFSKNYQRLAINVAQKEINSFVAEWEQKEAYKKDPFTTNYVRYALANLEDINNSASKDKLYDKYLKNQPILYQHKEYMNFFTQYYRLSFEQFALTKNGAVVLKALMLEEDLEKTIVLLQKFKNLENPALAELYLIYGLFEVYHKKTIQQEVSLSILNKISKKGKNTFNQRIAKNAEESLNQFNNSNIAPPFTLSNEKGEKIALSNFYGKPIYLSFWADWSIPSLRELKVMKTLAEKYGEKIHFVSINLDDNIEKMKKVKSNNNYNWTFLHFGEDYEVREKYNIKTVPSYFLIDEKGKFVQAHAEGPTKIERMLYNLAK